MAVDKVRLGRALGYGTRHAAKTLAAVAEAATAPDPRAPERPRPTQPAAPAQPITPAAATVARPAQNSTGTRRSAAARVPSAAAVRSAGRSLWGPLAAFSGALWLRVTGLFFGVIALAMANGAWRLRDRVSLGAMGTAAMHRFWLFALFAGLFGYFAASSFVRASLRERRAARQSRGME